MIFLGNVKTGRQRYSKGDEVPGDMDSSVMALLLENGLIGPGEDAPAQEGQAETPGPASGGAPVELPPEVTEEAPVSEVDLPTATDESPVEPGFFKKRGRPPKGA